MIPDIHCAIGGSRCKNILDLSTFRRKIVGNQLGLFTNVIKYTYKTNGYCFVDGIAALLKLRAGGFSDCPQHVNDGR